MVTFLSKLSRSIQQLRRIILDKLAFRVMSLLTKRRRPRYRLCFLNLIPGKRLLDEDSLPWFQGDVIRFL